jgi:signal transduction histidine kinase
VFGIAAGAVLVAWLCGGLAIYHFAEREYERMRHDNLVNLAQTVLRFVEHEIREIQQDGRPEAHQSPMVHQETAHTLNQRYAYQVWDNHGQLLLRSTRAPADSPLGQPGRPGLVEMAADGGHHDVYVQRSPLGDMEVHVAELADDSLAISLDFRLALLAAFALSFVPVVGLSYWLMRGSFDALLSVADQLEKRKSADLRPLAVHRPPKELLPLLRSVNGLMDRARVALDHEKKFTALAAHEMRTPLSALRVQAQVLARSQDGREIQESAQAVQRSVDRCTRLIDQLLELARADARQADRHALVPCRLDEACAEVISDFVEEAARRRVDISCDIAVAEIAADRVGLETILRNLLSNALRHTPDAGKIAITARRRAGEVIICVDDSGVGIPAADHADVFRRFQRGSNRAGSGAGLGLAIVQSIAEAHRAVIQLSQAPLGGLRAELRFQA